MAAKRIILVNAPPLAVLEPWYDTPLFVRTSIAFLAGYLRAHSNWEIKCLDAKFERKTFEQTAREIAEWNPTLVGFTAFTNEIMPSAYLAGLVKELKPSVITVCGGAHVTAIPEETLREFPTFDIGVVGEGEQTLLELCVAIEKNTGINSVNGLVYRSANGQILQTPQRHRILNYETLPLPAWDLLPTASEYYIQTVRGCPFACVFCMNHNGRVARKRTVNQVIEEMQWLIDHFKAKRISFGDELFSVDMKRTEQLLDAMIEHRIGQRVNWDIQTHVAYVNDTLLSKMKQANLQKIEMGVESGDEIILKRMGKGTTQDMIINAFRMAHSHGLKTGSFFIIGQPNETRKTILQSIRMAVKINPTEPIFGTMVPYPGTEIARMAAEGEGGYTLLSTNWDNYSKQLNSTLQVNGISPNQLKWFQIAAYIIVFLANLRLADFLNFLLSYRVAAYQILKRALMANRTLSDSITLPPRYYELINRNGFVTSTEMALSRTRWQHTQSGEVKYAKENMPTLLKEQIPL